MLKTNWPFKRSVTALLILLALLVLACLLTRPSVAPYTQAGAFGVIDENGNRYWTRHPQFFGFNSAVMYTRINGYLVTWVWPVGYPPESLWSGPSPQSLWNGKPPAVGKQRPDSEGAKE
jgi:hypothetical protein